MPWYNGDFPPSYKNQPIPLRNKAVEIANELLRQGLEEGIAIAAGLKRARAFFNNKAKEKPVSKMTAKEKTEEKRYREIYDEFRDFQLKKRQYSSALHIFHDHTAEYNNVIDDLSLKEMETHRKAFNQRERELHDVMDSFDRSLETYTQMLKQLKTSLRKPVTFRLKNKTIQLQMMGADLSVTES